MKRIYIAGPYSADNIMDVLSNIRQGQEMAAIMMHRGYAVYCPFLDYQLALTAYGPHLSKEMFQRNSMAWLVVSDAVYLLDGWENSKGTAAELNCAARLGIPTCKDMLEFSRLEEKWGKP